MLGRFVRAQARVRALARAMHVPAGDAQQPICLGATQLFSRVLVDVVDKHTSATGRHLPKVLEVGINNRAKVSAVDDDQVATHHARCCDGRDGLPRVALVEMEPITKVESEQLCGALRVRILHPVEGVHLQTRVCEHHRRRAMAAVETCFAVGLSMACLSRVGLELLKSHVAVWCRGLHRLARPPYLFGYVVDVPVEQVPQGEERRVVLDASAGNEAVPRRQLRLVDRWAGVGGCHVLHRALRNRAPAAHCRRLGASEPCSLELKCHRRRRAPMPLPRTPRCSSPCLPLHWNGIMPRPSGVRPQRA